MFSCQSQMAHMLMMKWIPEQRMKEKAFQEERFEK